LGMIVTGEWRSLPTIQAQQLYGAEIFQALQDEDGRRSLADRDLAVTIMGDGLKDGVEFTYPCLRLRCDQSRILTPFSEFCLKLVFTRIGVPWLPAMEFFCDPGDGQVAASMGTVIRTLTIGYPQYRCEFVVNKTAA